VALRGNVRPADGEAVCVKRGGRVDRHPFRGSALSAIDAKGRLSVPPFIRQKITLRADDSTLVLRKHPKFQCLEGYDTNYSEGILGEAKAERLSGDKDPLAQLAQNAETFGNSIDLVYDPTGRIILPGRLKKRSGIEDLALFIGLGETFTIWSPQVALACEIEAISDIAADLLEEKGIGA
jgi:MraZ protein